jgi:hypothetical protein
MEDVVLGQRAATRIQQCQDGFEWVLARRGLETMARTFFATHTKKG